MTLPRAGKIHKFDPLLILLFVFQLKLSTKGLQLELISIVAELWVGFLSIYTNAEYSRISHLFVKQINFNEIHSKSEVLP